MGRTLPPATRLMLEQVQDLAPVYDALRRREQLILDEVFSRLVRHKAAFNHAAAILPLEIYQALALVEAWGRMDRIRAELHDEIDKLRREITRRDP